MGDVQSETLRPGELAGGRGLVYYPEIVGDLREYAVAPRPGEPVDEEAARKSTEANHRLISFGVNTAVLVEGDNRERQASAAVFREAAESLGHPGEDPGRDARARAILERMGVDVNRVLPRHEEPLGEGVAESSLQRAYARLRILPGAVRGRALYDLYLENAGKGLTPDDEGIMAQIADDLERSVIVEGTLASEKAGGERVGAPRYAPDEELTRIENDLIYPDARSKADALREWIGRHSGDDVPDAIRQRAAGLLKRYGEEKLQEIKLDERGREELREAMLTAISLLTSNSDPDNAFITFLQQQTQKRGGFKHFEPAVEAKLRLEFTSRAELQVSAIFWTEIKRPMKKEADPYAEMSVNQVDRCHKLTKHAYAWMAGYRIVEDMVDGEVVGYKFEPISAEAVEIGRKRSRAASFVWEKIKSGELKPWTTIDLDRAKKVAELTKQARESGLEFGGDELELALNIAVAECWEAGRVDERWWLLHPAARLVKVSEWRRMKASINPAQVPGGPRLWFEYQGRHRNTPPANIFEAEGRKFARLGIEAWKKDSNGQSTDEVMRKGVRALENGTYFQDLTTMMADKDFVDVDLPQTVIMMDIVAAAAAFNALEAIGKKNKEISTGELDALRKELEGVCLRMTTSGIDQARKDVGILMMEWVKTAFWNSSWLNEIVTSEEQIKTVPELLKFFEAIVTAYEPNDGWGKYVGYGFPSSSAGYPKKPSPEAVSMAKEVVVYFEKLMLETQLRLERNTKPFMTAERRKKEIATLSQYDADRWKDTITMPIGIIMPTVPNVIRRVLNTVSLGGGGRGLYQIDESDNRWWLRK